MKKILAFALSLFMLFGLLPAYSLAAETVASGTCGDNLTWVLDDNYVLTITGTGAMTDYGSAGAVPWNAYRSQITTVSLPEGLTHVGNHAFEDCAALTTLMMGAMEQELSLSVVEYNGHYYATFANEVLWTEANALCKALGGHLVTVTSAEEDNFLSSLLFNGIEAYWLGGSDAETEGVWKWVTGEPWNYTNWSNDQPDNYNGTQDYLRKYQSVQGKKWDDIYNTDKTRFICEWEASNDFKNCETTVVSSPALGEIPNVIGNDAFAGCDHLQHIFFDGDADQWNLLCGGSGNEQLNSAAPFCNYSLVISAQDFTKNWAKEYYYPAGTLFVKNLTAFYHSASATAASNVKNAVGYQDAGGALYEGSHHAYIDSDNKAAFVDQDTTEGTGGDYFIYVGYTLTDDPAAANACKGVGVESDYYSAYYSTDNAVPSLNTTWYRVNSGANTNYAPRINPLEESGGGIDLNRGSGGSDIFLYAAYDRGFGPAIDCFTIISETDGETITANHGNTYYNGEGWYQSVAVNATAENPNLNQNASPNSGDRLFGYYHTPCVIVDSEALREAYRYAKHIYLNNEGATVALSAALAQASAILEDLQDGYTTSDQTAIDAAADGLIAAIEGTGHTYPDAWTVVSELSCVSAGQKTCECSGCGETLTVITAAPGHDYPNQWTVVTPPTCTTAGEETAVCTRCGEQTARAIPAVGHYRHASQTVTVLEPTCTTAGSQKEVCSRCGEEYTLGIAALGHDCPDEWTVRTPAGCTQPGVEYCVCRRCQEEVTRAIPATGHDWGEGAVTTEPTAMTAGVRTYTCANCGETKTETIPADASLWQNDENLGLANFTVVNAQSLAPLKNALIAVNTAAYGPLTARTDAQGQASMVLPVGKQQVTASYSGCIERTLNVNITHAVNDLPQIGLSDQPTVDATLTASVMTYEEIVSAGIDVENPENYNVLKYEATFVFEPAAPDPGPDTPPDPTTPTDPGTVMPQTVTIRTEYIVDEDTGATYVPSGTGGWVAGGGIYVPSFVDNKPAVIYPAEKFYLVVSGEVKWLSEMFDVQMYIWNNSATDTLEDLEATLTLPEGLSLAAMTEGEQSATQHIDHIAENGSAVAQWYVRGDEAGAYSLSATLTGTVMPFEEEFTNTYESDDTITVYGAGALEFTFASPDTFVCGEDYPIRITLTNISDRPLYNVAHMITGVKAFKVTQYKQEVAVKVKNAGAEYYPYSFDPEMLPGDSIVLEFSVSVNREDFYNRVFQLTDFVFCADDLVSAMHENFGYQENHRFGEWVITPAAYPCMAGVKTRTCEFCHTAEDEEIPATADHTPNAAVETPVTAVTCITDGVKHVFIDCAVCGTVLRDENETIPASGSHTPGEPVETVVREADCGNAGEKKITVKCTVCGETLSETTAPIPATGAHTPGEAVETIVTAATCLTDGVKRVVVTCTVCGNTLRDEDETIPASGSHTPGEPVETVVTPADCGNAGEKKITVKCTVCQETLSETTAPIPATGAHTPGTAVENIVTAATCLADGVKHVVITCSTCGETLKDEDETIPAIGSHTPGEPVETVIAKADCVHAGEKKITVSCALCGETLSETTEAIPATGEHTPGEPVETVVKAPTCTQEGEKTIESFCAVCGEKLGEITEAIGTTEHEDDDRDGVCNICGVKVCKYCHKVHPNTFIGAITRILHSIAYFFLHLFGKM